MGAPHTEEMPQPCLPHPAMQTCGHSRPLHTVLASLALWSGGTTRPAWVQRGFIPMATKLRALDRLC